MTRAPGPRRAQTAAAVIGAGIMGHGIAQVAAMAGYRVHLHDLDPNALDRAVERIRANLDRGVELGKVDPETRDVAVAGIEPTTRLEDIADADLVVEAVPEDLELKRRVIRELESIVSAETLLATNTSALLITAIAEAAERPGRVVGMHFFNPVHIMKLVEVIRGADTDPSAVHRARAAAEAMGKVAILVKDTPGFATSRLGVALGLEAMRMLEEGVASAEDIDRAMVLGYNHPMGPLRLSDLVGLDVRLAIAERLHRELGGDRWQPPEILRERVAAGKLGQKTGAGFFKWDRDQAP